jgi:fatty-acyl-CoA synthase
MNHEWTRDWLQRWALYTPNKVAISEYGTGRALTYKQLDAVGSRIAQWWQERGIQKGDRVAILAENSLEHFMLYAAALKTGVIVVPLNYRLAARELRHLIEDCAPVLVVVEDKFESVFQQQSSGGSPEQIAMIMRLADFAAMFFPSSDNDDGKQPFVSNATVENVQLHVQPRVQLHDDDPLFILYTSGTTGVPKGALYTHGMAFWNALSTALRLNLTANDHTLVFLPLFHTGGLNVFSTPFLYFGASFCLMKSFDAGAILQGIEAQKATVLMGVPTTMRMLSDAPTFHAADLSSLRYAIVGGEPMPVPLIELWHARGIFIRQGFGMTEVGPNLFSLHQDDATRKIGSIGLPNFYVETRVVNSDNDNDEDVLPDAEGNRSGELLIRGPMTTTGYWNNPKATAEALRGGWFHTGDIVRIDREGYFYVIDRKKNMFISGGENVYPAEIEKFLVRQPHIVDVAIVGVPDARWGEVGAAFVVKEPSASLSEEDVLSYCKNNLAKYKIPKYVHFLEELPKNDTGKINKLALKQLFQARQQESTAEVSP